MSREAMKLALEALENSADLVSNEAREAEKMYANVPTRLARVQGLVALEVAHEKAITALREELAEQPAQQEPVVRWDSDGWGDLLVDGLPDGTLLYTSPSNQPGYQAMAMAVTRLQKRCSELEGKQPAQQEPDAFVPREAIRTLSGGANHVPATLTLNDDGGKAVAVFLSPQPAQRTWVGLTDEEREQHRNDWHSNIHDKEFRAIEAKLKEKNNG